VPRSNASKPSIPIPPAPESHTSRIESPAAGPAPSVAPAHRDVLPATMQRLVIARAKLFEMARAGQRLKTYEVALDLDMSEFHFARQFRLAFDRSPHVYYDEVRAEKARELVAEGLAEGLVARRIGFRRPAELRALLAKRPEGTLPPELAR
jgi:AraC-like DNA-binding protein